MSKILLHAEGLAVFSLSLYLYINYGFGWVLFIALLLAPDISMLGYAIDVKIGSITYNLFHNYAIAIIVIIIGVWGSDTVLAIGLIWTAHIGLDRMLGYGLKYPTDFKDTHLNRV